MNVTLDVWDIKQGIQLQACEIGSIYLVMPTLEALQFEGFPVIINFGVGFGWFWLSLLQLLEEIPQLLVKKLNVRLFFYWFIVWRLGLGGSLDAAAVMDFVDSGHDLILAAGATTSEAIREIATECGADFDEVIYSIFIASICGKWHVVQLLNPCCSFQALMQDGCAFDMCSFIRLL